jgi:hypothetical protein
VTACWRPTKYSWNPISPSSTPSTCAFAIVASTGDIYAELGVTPLVPDAPATSFVDPGAVPSPPDLWFYRVNGLSPCSLTAGE